MSRPRRIVPVALIVVLALGVSACGSTTSTSSNGGATTSQSTTSFAKTKFVLHAGLAFGAFHHFIYKPYKSGGLHGFGLIKAGLAGLFAYHEVKLALADAQSSPLLRKLVAPLTALQGKLQDLGTKLKGGNVDQAAIESTNTQVGTTSAASSAAGQPVTETTPSAGQLAGG
jgi:hypothetical protein